MYNSADNGTFNVRDITLNGIFTIFKYHSVNMKASVL